MWYNMHVVLSSASQSFESIGNFCGVRSCDNRSHMKLVDWTLAYWIKCFYYQSSWNGNATWFLQQGYVSFKQQVRRFVDLKLWRPQHLYWVVYAGEAMRTINDVFLGLGFRVLVQYFHLNLTKHNSAHGHTTSEPHQMSVPGSLIAGGSLSSTLQRILAIVYISQSIPTRGGRCRIGSLWQQAQLCGVLHM
jgi:hypothetical protein